MTEGLRPAKEQMVIQFLRLSGLVPVMEVHVIPARRVAAVPGITRQSGMRTTFCPGVVMRHATMIFNQNRKRRTFA